MDLIVSVPEFSYLICHLLIVKRFGKYFVHI